MLKGDGNENKQTNKFVRLSFFAVVCTTTIVHLMSDPEGNS